MFEAEEKWLASTLGLRTHRNFWLLIVVLRLWLYKQGVAWLSTTSTLMRYVQAFSMHRIHCYTHVGTRHVYVQNQFQDSGHHLYCNLSLVRGYC